jgi:hypothetical protein
MLAQEAATNDTKIFAIDLDRNKYVSLRPSVKENSRA